MKKFITIAIVLILASLSFAQPRIDQDRHMMAQDRFDLSDVQMSQLQELRGEHQKDMIPLRADLKVKKIELKELIADGKSKRLIESKQNSILKIHSKMANLKTDHLIKVRKIVGEENFKKMGAMKKHHGKRDHYKRSMGYRR